MAERGGNRSTAHSGLCRAITDYLLLRGAWVLKVLGGIGQRAGVPDLLFALPVEGVGVAALGAVEVKTGTAVLSRAQRAERESMERVGIIYIEARSLDDVEEALLDAGLIRDRALRPVGSRR